MIGNNPMSSLRTCIDLASGLRCAIGKRTITFFAPWLGLLLLAGCGAGSKYFHDGVNEATQAMVGKRYGTPHKIQSSTDGGEIWIYFERGSGTAGFSGQARGGGCRAYYLTFDKETILREWQQQDCHG